MKALSSYMMAIFLLLIGVAFVSMVYYWSIETVPKIYPNETQDASFQRARACLSIDKIENDLITISNCGLTPLQNFTLYVDNKEIERQDLDALKLNPKQSYQFTYTQPAGEHTYYIISDFAESAVVKK